MISKRKLNHGFDGYRAAIIPKAPRSIRKRPQHRNLIKGNELCAFDLLAAVAGKLLQESESSASSNVAERGANREHCFVDDKSVKSESLDHGSCAESAFIQANSIRDCSDDPKNDTANPSTVKDHADEFVDTNAAAINSDDSVNLPVYSGPVGASIGVNIGRRDDDENSSRRDKDCAEITSYLPQPRGGCERVMKISMCNHRKANSTQGIHNAGDGTRFFNECRKRSLTARRWQQARARFKKRKLSDRRSVVVSDQDNSSDSISNSTDSLAIVGGDEEAKDHFVKFSIKSFKVPELCIEIPENASLGSLKKAVMETVNSIFGSGLEVGVVFQGEILRDDRKTLYDAGITEKSNLESLGFTLESSFTSFSALPQDFDQELLRSSATQIVDSGLSDANIDSLPPVSNFDDNNSSELKSSPQTSTNKTVPDSKALVPVPLTNEMLAIVPVDQKSKRCENSHRRTRRPFTVAEVEALVESVEKLGTGRWRDVKIAAFELADHRTYVDLKDKWKTLVHTASISPQQRRGEPVPQELLDRVLAAHSYWSLQQPRKLPAPVEVPAPAPA
ncbi:telomere repeat-binding protein 4-like [Andrographis paniculata]|uniref:telomere repeat-binding protein 4-like n=1 Tax=Andrographis paniculata TaxID=175694 RepID=UPI0021E8B2A8|nr:telomere repeat-binding protein 4-like [Andrographis paniculata]